MRLTAVTFLWGGEERTFDLKLGQVRALQEKTGLGPAMILANLQSGAWKVDEYRETIRQGLIGGGIAALEADKLIRSEVDEQPAKESLKPAQSILLSFLVGSAPTKKAKEVKNKTGTATAPAASTSPPSTE